MTRLRRQTSSAPLALQMLIARMVATPMILQIHFYLESPGIQTEAAQSHQTIRPVIMGIQRHLTKPRSERVPYLLPLHREIHRQLRVARGVSGLESVQGR